MLACGTGGQFLELVPIVYDFITAGPSFFEIVEDGHPWVIMTLSFLVLLDDILFQAAVSFALLFSHWSRHCIVEFEL